MVRLSCYSPTRNDRRYGEIVKVSTDLSLLRIEGEPSRFTEDLGVLR
jgi:hypothetical protein